LVLLHVVKVIVVVDTMNVGMVVVLPIFGLVLRLVTWLEVTRGIVGEDGVGVLVVAGEVAVPVAWRRVSVALGGDDLVSHIEL
jgi:hypothetical protein